MCNCIGSPINHTKETVIEALRQSIGLADREGIKVKSISIDIENFKLLSSDSEIVIVLNTSYGFVTVTGQ